MIDEKVSFFVITEFEFRIKKKLNKFYLILKNRWMNIRLNSIEVF